MEVLLLSSHGLQLVFFWFLVASYFLWQTKDRILDVVNVKELYLDHVGLKKASWKSYMFAIFTNPP